MRFAVLTRDQSAYGLRLLDRLAEQGLHPVAIGVESQTWRSRFRMARYLARRTGLPNAVWHNAIFWTRALRHSMSRRPGRSYGGFAARVVTVRDINSEPVRRLLEDADVDLVLLGQSGIIRQPLLDVPRLGTLNAHPGVLPAFRGVDVLRWTLAAGAEPGVTLHFVDRGVDTGDIIEVVRLREQTADVALLEQEAARIAIELLVTAVLRLRSGASLPRTPQSRAAGRQYFLMPPWTRWKMRNAGRGIGSVRPEPEFDHSLS